MLDFDWSLTAGAFVFYFNDAPTLIHDILNFQVSTTVLAFVGGLTMSTYIMAGFAWAGLYLYVPLCPFSIGDVWSRNPYYWLWRDAWWATWEVQGANRDHLRRLCWLFAMCTGLSDGDRYSWWVADPMYCLRALCGCLWWRDGEGREALKGICWYDTEHNLELRAQGHNPELFCCGCALFLYGSLSVVGLAMLGSFFGVRSWKFTRFMIVIRYLSGYLMAVSGMGTRLKFWIKPMRKKHFLCR